MGRIRVMEKIGRINQIYFHLKNQTRDSAITYGVIEMVGCQKSKCSSSWPFITTFTSIVNIQRGKGREGRGEGLERKEG